MSERQFSAHEKRVLNWALDQLVPPGAMPGAGEIGIADYVEQALQPTPEMGAMVVRAVAALDDIARGRGVEHFLALGAADRVAAFGQVESSANPFPPMLMVLTFSGYYQHPRVLEILGLESRPPHPQGYEMAPNDLSLLDPVRQRGKFYRDI